MFIIDSSALAREAARRYLEGKPTAGIAERSLRIFEAAKVVDFGAARARLRSVPPQLQPMDLRPAS